MGFDIGKALWAGVRDWTRSAKLRRWFVVFFVAYAVLAAVSGLIVVGWAGGWPQLIALSATADSQSAIQSIIGPDMDAFLIRTLVMAAMIIGIGILAGILFTALSAALIRDLLEFRGLPARRIDASEAARFVLFSVYKSLVVVVLWMDAKWAALVAAWMILFIGGIGALVVGGGNSLLSLVGVLLLIGGAVAFLAYLVVLVYQSYRILMASFLFVSKDQSMTASLRESWELTAGRALDLFIAFLVGALVLGILSAIVSGLAKGLLMLPGQMANDSGLLLAGIVGAGIVQSACNAFVLLGVWAMMAELYVQLREKKGASAR